jgi:predicted lipoprotein with Yx(FWY)xxD motif
MNSKCIYFVITLASQFHSLNEAQFPHYIAKEAIMKNRLIFTFSGALIVLLTFASGASIVAAAGPDATVATSTLGKIVVDGKGMTAYFFDRDSANSGTSACTGQCAVNWPAITSASTVPSVVGISGTVGSIAATKQITINGRPIYTYLFDTAVGETKGQGVGGVWFVISPAGVEMQSPEPTISAQPSTTPTPSQSPKPTTPAKPKLVKHPVKPVIKPTHKPIPKPTAKSTVEPKASPTDTATSVPSSNSNY